MDKHEILNYSFDAETRDCIIDFAKKITESHADIYITMSRKAACFIDFLEKYDYISFSGQVFTDRILNYDCSWMKDKKVIIIDDVIVSGTTIYTVIKKLKAFFVNDIKVMVLGVDEPYCSLQLFDYFDAEGNAHNYLQSPYLLLSDEGCMRMCSNIVSLFALDIAPYDVDFPKHKRLSISNKKLDYLISNSDWTSYDVSSDLQAENNIINVTLLPTTYVKETIDNQMGFPLSKLGFFKIRIFAKPTSKKKEKYSVNAVPYFMFNEICQEDINFLFAKFMTDKLFELDSLSKIRILQYIFAEKLFNFWSNSINKSTNTEYKWILDKNYFCKVFPIEYWNLINGSIKTSIKIQNIEIQNFNYEYKITDFDSKIQIQKDQNDNFAVLQSKLVEPFTNLYLTKEKDSRNIVLKYGKEAFEMTAYKNIIDRLNHGFSVNNLIDLLSDFPDIFDKETTVSLFVDEALDAGVIVPIIAEETIGNKKIFYRAFRHGEDVPFGELQEKLCSVMLENYYKVGGKQILTKLRVEKMLVLFIKIGLNQKIFKPSPQDSIYYQVNIDAYIHGNILTAESHNSPHPQHYLKHRTDARWLSDILIDKGIIETQEKTSKANNNDSMDEIFEQSGINTNYEYIGINNCIEIPIDKTTQAKAAAIGQTFAILYNNYKEKIEPYVNDEDLVMFSTCLYPNDLVNALAAELAIYYDRWQHKKRKIDSNISNNNYSELFKDFNSGELYTSINSGQNKFTKFHQKYPQKRIDEISKQLANDPFFSIYATHWDQFWSESRYWNENSIDKTLSETIKEEGKILFALNILFRLVLICCASDDKRRDEILQQIVNIKETIKGFSLDSIPDLKKVISFSNKIIQKNSNEGIYKNDLITICKAIMFYAKRIPSLLTDVELLVNKHGKICEIIRYNNAIHIEIPSCLLNDITQKMRSYLEAQTIEYKAFPIANPTDIFSKTGLWLFVKNNSGIQNIKNIILQILNDTKLSNAITHIDVFLNLSENLKLKVATDCNSRFRFGNFSSYSQKILETRDQLDYLNKSSIFWIIEDCQKNKKLIKNIKTALNNEITVAKTTESEYETTVSSISKIIVSNKTSRIDLLRKDYKNMSRKCKIFVSYTEGDQVHFERIKTIVNRLRNENFVVYFFEDAPLGTDMVRFMRNINDSDIVLLVGSPDYKERAYYEDESGVNFEDRLISDVFSSVDRTKIVPVAFEKVNDCIPSPFNKLKGMVFKKFDEEEMNIFVSALINKFKKSNVD
ncbi:TIR domain-containing protein [bacterium]|nr:TIR domain-containing protein [bacterium]